MYIHDHKKSKFVSHRGETKTWYMYINIKKRSLEIEHKSGIYVLSQTQKWLPLCVYIYINYECLYVTNKTFIRNCNNVSCFEKHYQGREQ